MIPRDAEATRARLIAAATEEFARHGVAGARVDRIADQARTNKAQIYHYFGPTPKTELVEAVVEYQIERVLNDQGRFLENLQSMRGLERWRDSVVVSVRGPRGAHGCPIGSLASELSDRSESARVKLDQAFTVWEQWLRDGLERMREAGELRQDANTGALAVGLMAAVQGGYLLSQTRRDGAAMAMALDMALDAVRGALASTS
mgnify:CR=1 FL=1